MQLTRGADTERKGERGDARHTSGRAEDERIHLGSSGGRQTNRLRHTQNAVLSLKANHRHPGLHISGQSAEPMRHAPINSNASRTN